MLRHTKEEGAIHMWKPTQYPVSAINPIPPPESVVPASKAPGIEPIVRRDSTASAVDQATIGSGMIVKGEITGAGSLLIDGRVEGSVNLPNERVSIGQKGRVVASMTASMSVCITAREIVVMGTINGNVSASDRVEIRAEGKLTGDVSASRISIEDGAFFRGGVDLRKPNGDSSAGTSTHLTGKMA
jgi:cytoskeletal protein CcmA (bactofilin family)